MIAYVMPDLVQEIMMHLRPRHLLPLMCVNKTLNKRIQENHRYFQRVAIFLIHKEVDFNGNYFTRHLPLIWRFNHGYDTEMEDFVKNVKTHYKVTDLSVLSQRRAVKGTIHAYFPSSIMSIIKSEVQRFHNVHISNACKRAMFKFASYMRHANVSPMQRWRLTRTSIKCIEFGGSVYFDAFDNTENPFEIEEFSQHFELWIAHMHTDSALTETDLSIRINVIDLVRNIIDNWMQDTSDSHDYKLYVTFYNIRHLCGLF